MFLDKKVIANDKQALFDVLKQKAYMWDRKDANTLTAWCKKDKYFDLQSAIMAAGGAVMSKTEDSHNGMFALTIREPKTKNNYSSEG